VRRRRAEDRPLRPPHANDEVAVASVALHVVGVALWAGGAHRTDAGPQGSTRPGVVAPSHVMRGLAELAVHEDVPDGMRALRASGRRLVTLTNGSTQGSERLLTDTGVRDRFQALLSVEDAGAWKPVRTAYEYAARAYGTDPADMLGRATVHRIGIGPGGVLHPVSAGLQVPVPGLP
jgi:hypothetical protein